MNSATIGFRDDPSRAYLVAGGRRHWISTPVLLQQCGITSLEQAHTAVKDGPALHQSRDYLAIKHLKGHGIEIGALNCPSVMPSWATVEYVDYISAEEARRRYPGLTVPSKVRVDDGETLASFFPSSLDFIVANHFLEHTRNPLGVIRTHLSKLKNGGVLLYALPDKRYSFDRDRAVTPFQHLVMDDQHGWEISDRWHYLDYVRHVDKVEGAKAIEAHATVLKEMDNRIHFHVWDADGIREMFALAADYLGGVEVVEIVEAGLEVITVMRKS